MGRLDHLPNGIGLLLPTAQVGVDRGRMPQVIADHGIHIGEVERVVGFDDLLRGGTVPELLNDQVQKNPDLLEKVQKSMPELDLDAKKLKDLADKEHLSKISLATLSTKAGPEAYKIDKDAEVTVILYGKNKCQANYAFKKGAMTESDVDKIVADVAKILPEKE